MIPVLLSGLVLAGCATQTEELATGSSKTTDAATATAQAPESTFAVPSLVDKTVAEAAEIVAGLGGTLLADLDEPENVVTSQEVPAGIDVAVGTEIVVTAEPVQAEVALNLAETSFWWDTSMEEWRYAVIVENPSADQAWFDAEFTVEAYAADGTLLDSDFFFRSLPPGVRTAASGQFWDAGAGEIDHLEVRAPEEGINVAGQEFGAYSISAPEKSVDGSSTVLSGTIESTFIKDRNSVEVIALVRDASGAIVDTESNYVDRVPAMGKVRYEIEFFTYGDRRDIAETDTFEVFADFGWTE